jgi:hypothetical protein
MGGRLTGVQMGGRGPAAGGRTSRRGRAADLPSGFDGRATGGCRVRQLPSVREWRMARWSGKEKREEKRKGKKRKGSIVILLFKYILYVKKKMFCQTFSN